MKKLLFALCCVALILEGCNGCKENNPAIVWPKVIIPGTDSSYVLDAGSIPAAQPHVPLVEEFSGQDCNNCPSAHGILDGISGINVVTMYVFNQNQSIPPSPHIYDFRDSTAWAIQKQIYIGLNGLPSAGVDRTPPYPLVGGLAFSGPINTQKTTITDSINVDVSSSSNSGIFTIKVTVTYLQQFTTKQNISIYVVEDSLYDNQADLNKPGGYNAHYLFLDVFRAMVATPPYGDGILDTMSTKPKGQVYWRKYKFNPATTNIVNVNNCRVIAFVNNPGPSDFRVLQSVQCRLVP